MIVGKGIPAIGSCLHYSFCTISPDGKLQKALDANFHPPAGSHGSFANLAYICSGQKHSLASHQQLYSYALSRPAQPLLRAASKMQFLVRGEY